jgi:hypothetical protein
MHIEEGRRKRDAGWNCFTSSNSFSGRIGYCHSTWHPSGHTAQYRIG